MPSTKDSTHLRRRSSKTGRSVNITPLMKLNTKEESFQTVLINKDLFNKEFVQYINSQNCGITAVKTTSDADVQVVKTAVSYSVKNDVVVISGDTEVLIVLLYHTK